MHLCVCMSVWVGVGVHRCALVGLVCVGAEEPFKKEEERKKKKWFLLHRMLL